MESSIPVSWLVLRPEVMLQKLLDTNPSKLKFLVATIMLGVLASTVAIGYSELIFRGTRQLYIQGKLTRYYPLPSSRGAVTAWINSMSFTVPTALYAGYMQADLKRGHECNIMQLAFYTVLYMLLHDAYFYWCHRTFHNIKPLYDHLHAMHHEYSYAMHCFIVGHAEIAENFIQVGIPWVLWTAIAGHNWWYWTLPLSFVLYTTLIGHSGYRASYHLMFFHPFSLPIALASGRWMLTTGDHQMQRVNFGLFWRFWDTYCGTYKKCCTKAQDVHFWRQWSRMAGTHGHDENAKKWLGRNQVDFHEIEWGF